MAFGSVMTAAALVVVTGCAAPQAALPTVTLGIRYTRRGETTARRAPDRAQRTAVTGTVRASWRRAGVAARSRPPGRPQTPLFRPAPCRTSPFCAWERERVAAATRRWRQALERRKERTP